LGVLKNQKPKKQILKIKNTFEFISVGATLVVAQLSILINKILS
jgi:hypothetical protein